MIDNIIIINPALISSIVAGSVVFFLGLTILLHNWRNATNIVYASLAFVFIIWTVVNYLALIGAESELFWIRLIMILVVIQIALFMLFVINFPLSSMRKVISA